MPWVTRGMRNRLLTSTWPKRDDAYFDGFPAAVTVGAAPTKSPATDDGVEAAVSGCPTQAITEGERGPQLDRGRCILCGHCIVAAPDVFAWQQGSAVARLEREALVVEQTPESNAALHVLRTTLAARARWLRRSVHIRHVDARSDGSDEWEVQALTNPVYDLHRLGIFFTASPRHADILGRRHRRRHGRDQRRADRPRIHLRARHRRPGRRGRLGAGVARHPVRVAARHPVGVGPGSPAAAPVPAGER